jgi:hypothetical protein
LKEFESDACNDVPPLFLTGAKQELKENITAQGRFYMAAWLADAGAGIGLVIFIGSAFVLAGAVPALLAAL